MDSVLGTGTGVPGTDRRAGIGADGPGTTPHPTADGADDRALVARIAAGDAEALAQLYDRHGCVVFGLLRRMLGTPELAQEATEATFQAVRRQAAGYLQERGPVRHWLLAITRTAAAECHRTKGRSVGATAAIEAESDVGHPIVEGQAGTGVRDRGVREKIASMPTEQRLALRLAIWSGLSQRQIANRTGAPLELVKTWVRLGMTDLRGQLLDRNAETEAKE